MQSCLQRPPQPAHTSKFSDVLSFVHSFINAGHKPPAYLRRYQQGTPCFRICWNWRATVHSFSRPRIYTSGEPRTVRTYIRADLARSSIIHGRLPIVTVTGTHVDLRTGGHQGFDVVNIFLFLAYHVIRSSVFCIRIWVRTTKVDKVSLLARYQGWSPNVTSIIDAMMPCCPICSCRWAVKLVYVRNKLNYILSIRRLNGAIYVKITRFVGNYDGFEVRETEGSSSCAFDLIIQLKWAENI